MTKLIHVAAAVIYDSEGRILLARRPDDKHQGGLWEFPGGKVEAGEPVLKALARELEEELGIMPEQAAPLIRIPYHYPDKSVLLDVYEVTAFQGEPWGREGQPIEWVAPHQLDNYDFPAANRPILNAVLMPHTLAITGRADNSEHYMAKIRHAIRFGAEGVMLRAHHLPLPQFRLLAERAIQAAREEAFFLSLNCDLELANELGADALHLTGARLEQLKSRADFNGRWLSASCHSAEQLARAQALGLDFVTLSPVQATRTHPEVTPLGWECFAELVADVALPVLALGGMEAGDEITARASGGQGIAAISAWWG